MYDDHTLSDRVAIDALRSEFTDAVMMRDYDRVVSLFTSDGQLRIPDIPVDLTGPDEIRSWGRRVPETVAFLVQHAHPGAVAVDGDTAAGRVFIEELCAPGMADPDSTSRSTTTSTDASITTGSSLGAPTRSATSTRHHWRAPPAGCCPPPRRRPIDRRRGTTGWFRGPRHLAPRRRSMGDRRRPHRSRVHHQAPRRVQGARTVRHVRGRGRGRSQDLASSRFEACIALDSITTGSPDRDTNVESALLLDVARRPTLVPAPSRRAACRRRGVRDRRGRRDDRRGDPAARPARCVRRHRDRP